MDHWLVLLLGSNLGNRIEHLERARLEVTAEVGVILQMSHIYESEPWGLKEQSPFLNQALIVETEFRPHIVLQNILQIEKSMGRMRQIPWGPRMIDIDILFYEELIYEAKDLQIPHPHIADRRFVLTPLQEMIPEFRHPVLGDTMKELLNKCEDPGYVNIYES